MRFKYSFAILNSGIYTGGESLKQVSGLQVHFGESLFLRSCLEGSDNGVVGLEVFLQKAWGQQRVVKIHFLVRRVVLQQVELQEQLTWLRGC